MKAAKEGGRPRCGVPSEIEVFVGGGHAGSPTGAWRVESSVAVTRWRASPVISDPTSGPSTVMLLTRGRRTNRVPADGEWAVVEAADDGEGSRTCRYLLIANPTACACDATAVVMICTTRQMMCRFTR